MPNDIVVLLAKKTYAPVMQNLPSTPEKNIRDPHKLAKAGDKPPAALHGKSQIQENKGSSPQPTTRTETPASSHSQTAAESLKTPSPTQSTRSSRSPSPD